MLVFKGLALALLQGQSVGPFPECLPAAQLGLHPRLLRRRGLRMTSLLLGVAVAAALAVRRAARPRQASAHGMEDEPSGLLPGQERRLRRRLIYFS